MTSHRSDAPPPRSAAHLPLLDSLRGLAAVLVLVAHAAREGFLPGFLGGGFGQVGVTTFFALSGFLMAHIYFERDFTATELRTYAVSRGGRVLPLYYLVVGGCSLLLLVIGTSLYGIMDLRGVALNLALVRGDGVFWSIPVEIHFYVLFVGLWWARSRGRLGVAVTTLLLAEVGLQLAFRDAGLLGRWIFYWAHVFLAGVGVSVLKRWLEGRGVTSLSNRWHLLGWVALALVPLLPPLVRQAAGIPIGPHAIDPISFGGPVLFLVCGVFALGPVRALDVGWARWLGRVSFGIYLLHVPFLIVARELGPWIGAVPGAQFAFALVGTLIASAISFRLVEAPAAALARRRLLPPRKRPDAISAGGIEGASRAPT